jgi:hypothetical protein
MTIYFNYSYMGIEDVQFNLDREITKALFVNAFVRLHPEYEITKFEWTLGK